MLVETVEIRRSDLGDTIAGGQPGELLYGLSGNDTILGMGGDDILVGGKGDDLLQGGSGNDTYRFSRGLTLGSTLSTRSEYRINKMSGTVPGFPGWAKTVGAQAMLLFLYFYFSILEKKFGCVLRAFIDRKYIYILTQ